MIDKKILIEINKKIDENKIVFDGDAEVDIIKQGHNWSKDFIKKCLKEGKKYTGKELYPDKEKRHNRYYCIQKQSLLSTKLILIGFLLLEDILIIHISPLNKGSKEGKIYYNL